MVASQVRPEDSDDHRIEAAHENRHDEDGGGGIYDFCVKHETQMDQSEVRHETQIDQSAARHETPPSSAYSSTQTSPVKKRG